MPQEGPDRNGNCWPQCLWFKCGKHAIQIRGKNIMCAWLADVCVGPSCSYTLCVRGKMLPNNRCGLVVRRITADTLKPDDFQVDVKIKGRLARRLREEDLV